MNQKIINFIFLDKNFWFSRFSVAVMTLLKYIKVIFIEFIYFQNTI